MNEIKTKKKKAAHTEAKKTRESFTYYELFQSGVDITSDIVFTVVPFSFPPPIPSLSVSHTSSSSSSSSPTHVSPPLFLSEPLCHPRLPPSPPSVERSVSAVDVHN